MTILDEAVAIAGVDPRALAAQLMAGQPDRTIQLARAFEEAGSAARDAYERGRRAHAAVGGGFSNNAAAVLDVESQSQQAWRLLGQGGQDMEDTAAFLKRSVTALDDAQTTSTAALNRMTTQLNGVVAAWNQQLSADPAAGPALRQQYLVQAVAIVTTAGTDIQRAIDGYDRGLTRDATELANRGYAPSTATVAAMYEGGSGPLTGPGGAMPLTPTLPPPGTDQYRGLSLPNGLLTTADVLSGLNGARLEASGVIRLADGTLIKSAAEGELARLRGQERVLDPARFYRDIDYHLGRVSTADDIIKSAESTSRASKTLPIKVGGALAIAGIGIDIANGKDPVQAVASGGGGFLASVAAGAVIGTAIPIPGVGTAVGAVVGGVVGVFASGAIDSVFENGPDVGTAFHRGVESVADTGKAIGGGIKAVGHGISGLFG